MEHLHSKEPLHIKNYPASIKLETMIYMLSHPKQTMSAIQLIFLNDLICKAEGEKENFKNCLENSFFL